MDNEVVFNRDLKVSLLSESRMLQGKWFHNVAANALSPHVLYFFLGKFNFKDAFDLREYLPCACIVNILVMQDGSMLFSALYVSNNILNSILCSTGS